MTAFTLAHTAISLLPVGFGLAAYARHGAINPATRTGKWYVGTMIASAVTGFGFLVTIGFTPGQVLGLVALALVLVGALRPAGYVRTTALTTSFLLLMVFLTTEALKRFPLDHPFATGPADPALLPVRLALLAGYAAGLGYQLWNLHAEPVFDARVRRFLELAAKAA